MKSVGEAMAIGRTFKKSLPKGLCSLETGRSEPGLSVGGGPEPSEWSVGAEVYGDFDNLPHNVFSGKLSMSNGERILFIRTAIRTPRHCRNA